ncbi:UBP1-associated proteins 1C [Rhodamnia argentea]|uniref:UBP1-associated proteins 1C n=1 Tax=Rhodamnia argentea TaxID=178133 RepID=A0A8B8P5F0_9MYRT|nr:UBP1-associated proteins 1C [Rhodamnia argentea]
MVWFQCEDCGENLKKPKLPNHFRVCSAFKLSCIDCGETFSQQSVQGHTQCITEAEKYGPKGQGKVSNGMPAKPNKDAKQQPDFDITVGLTKRPPWLCSLCNTKATSEQTLLLHAEGKKHKAKARAFHASKQQPQQKQESTSLATLPPEDDSKSRVVHSEHAEEQKVKSISASNNAHSNSKVENGNSQSNKKRKHDGSEKFDRKKTTRHDNLNDVGDGEVIQADKTEMKKSKQVATARENPEDGCHPNEDARKKIKWKKLIKTTLKSNPDGKMKIKKLKKLVIEAIKHSGITEDENQLSEKLERKINSSSRFAVDSKYVRLVASD